MGGLVESLGRSFERLLRWLYPGALFLVLLYLSSRSVFNSIRRVQDPWALVFVAIVAGMVTYLLQTYVVNQFISLLFDLPCLRLLSTDTEQLKGRPKCLAEGAARWGEPAWRRWGISWHERSDEQAKERLNSWLDYSWSTYHAGFITVWLTLVFFCNSDRGSFLSNISPWLVWGLAIPLIASLLWQYLILTRVTLRISERQN